MPEEKKPLSSRELDDEIQKLKADMASLKQRFATRPEEELERELAALATERAHPMSTEEKDKLAVEIQQFKSEITALRTKLVSDVQKLAQEDDGTGQS